jgi:hypothetical protein
MFPEWFIVHWAQWNDKNTRVHQELIKNKQTTSKTFSAIEKRFEIDSSAIAHEKCRALYQKPNYTVLTMKIQRHCQQFTQRRPTHGLICGSSVHSPTTSPHQVGAFFSIFIPWDNNHVTLFQNRNDFFRSKHQVDPHLEGCKT